MSPYQSVYQNSLYTYIDLETFINSERLVYEYVIIYFLFELWHKTLLGFEVLLFMRERNHSPQEL